MDDSQLQKLAEYHLDALRKRKGKGNTGKGKKGACFNCGADDHWANDCPHPKKGKGKGGKDRNGKGKGLRAVLGDDVFGSLATALGAIQAPEEEPWETEEGYWDDYGGWHWWPESADQNQPGVEASGHPLLQKVCRR